MKRKAFTMAEVLITLMIIGVIAAMTIPTLQKNAEQQELAAGCLKAYSTLNNAISRMTVDYGALGSNSNWKDVSKFTNNIVNYLNVAKKCDSSNKYECFLDTGVEAMNGGANGYEVTANSFITNDGMSFTYRACGTESLYGITEEDYDNCLGRFMVDVNGPKKSPNIVGYDVYCFVVVDGTGIVPCGANSIANCKPSATGTSAGMSCAAYVIANKKVYSE